jgi:hypothetical protein
MRRSVTLAFALLLVAGLVGPAGAVLDTDAYPVPGVSVTTDNVTHVGYMADLGPTVSAAIVHLEDESRLYASSIGRGLSIYDITDPELPLLMGTFPIAGFQNEDMSVSEDGDFAIVSYDTTGGNYYFDTSDPLAPVLASRTTPGDHTTHCVVPDCSVIYGSTTGRIYDASDPYDVQIASTGWRQIVQAQLGQNLQQNAHAFYRDEAGYVHTDTIPRLMLDVEDPFNPQVLATSARGGEWNAHNLRYQHNVIRPRALDWEPRDEETEDIDEMLPGELAFITGETNLAPQCGSAQGPFATMSLRDWDQGAQMEVVDVFRPTGNSNYLDGDPAVNVLGCSSHWFDWTFDQSDETGGTYIVSVAMFEHGARFMQVDAGTGEIEEIGFFQPVNGSAGAAYWYDDEYVFVSDYVRGIDILRFDHDPDLRPSEDELAANWAASAERETLEITKTEQLICRLATE